MTYLFSVEAEPEAIEVRPKNFDVEVSVSDIIDNATSGGMSLLAEALIDSAVHTTIDAVTESFIGRYTRDSFARQRVDSSLEQKGYKLVKLGGK